MRVISAGLLKMDGANSTQEAECSEPLNHLLIMCLSPEEREKRIEITLARLGLAGCPDAAMAEMRRHVHKKLGPAASVELRVSGQVFCSRSLYSDDLKEAYRWDVRGFQNFAYSGHERYEIETLEVFDAEQSDENENIHACRFVSGVAQTDLRQYSVTAPVVVWRLKFYREMLTVAEGLSAGPTGMQIEGLSRLKYAEGRIFWNDRPMSIGADSIQPDVLRICVRGNWLTVANFMQAKYSITEEPEC